MRPDRVQMNAAHQFRQADFFLAQYEFKAVLEKVAASAMASIFKL
jgi:hypothetical protein